VVTLDPRQGVDQFRITDHETDAPARHVVALGQGEKLHRDILGARHLHDRRGFPAVVDDVGVSQIVNHQHVVLLGEGDHPFEEIQLHALAVGFDGKPRIIIFGFGIEPRIARSSSSKKSTPGISGTERTCAPAITAP
jgi:hypothetical protein